MSQKTTKVHKTIFHTTEKSNFILNMTSDQFNKFASIAISAGIGLIFIMSCISEIMSHSAERYSNDWRIYPSFGLAAAGIAGISIFIIALIKQTLTKKQIAASLTALLMMIFMYISYINAFTDVEDYSGFLGYRYGRYEGLMTYLSYLFIFAGAMSINKKESFRTIFDTVSVVTLLQCLWSALQFIPSFPNHFHKMPYLIDNVSISGGVTGSPYFLAVFLTAGISISAAGAVFDSSPKRKIFYSIVTALSSFFMIWTHTTTGMASALILTVLFIIFYFASKKNKKTNISFIPVIVMIAGFAAGFAAMLATTGINILDGEIIWHDGCQRLSSFGQHTNDSVYLSDIPAVYSYLWDKAFHIIGKYPVTGIGPDGFVLPDMIIGSGIPSVSPNCFDRPYNEYLFYAATLGIPFCISFIAALLFSLICALRSAVKYIKGKGSWVRCAAFAGILIYIITAFTGAGSSTATFLPWLLLGIGCCTLSEEK